MEPTVKAIGYVRVSTDEQFSSGAGIDAQRALIEAEAARRGWDLTIVGERAGASSATLEREGLQQVMRQLDKGEADVLIVAKLDRLSRSVIQGAVVMERAKAKKWKLIALDFGLDTTTPAGEMVATVVLSMAQYERRLIGERTKAALAAKKAAGVVLGRPQTLSPAIVDRIKAARAAGDTLTAIADALTADRVPTAQGGARWYPSTIAAVLRSRAASAAMVWPRVV
jgi:DNA invertase Pin-like site-specific DNA recombinase